MGAIISSTLEEIKRHNTDELQFCKGVDPCRQESIDDVHAKKERLGQQSESGVLHRMYLNQPIKQNLAHRPGQSLLRRHVFQIGESGELRVRY